MVCSPYGGCVLVLLLLGGWRGGLESDKLRIGRFSRILSLILM